MPYRTPAEILKTNRSIQTDLNGDFILKAGLNRDKEWTKAVLKQADEERKAREALAREQTRDESLVPHSGIGDVIKHVGGGILKTADLLRSTAQSGLNEGVDFLHSVTEGAANVIPDTEITIPGTNVKINSAKLEDIAQAMSGGSATGSGSDRVQQSGLSLDDFITNARSHANAKDYIQQLQGGDKLPSYLLTGAGIVGDIATDPITYTGFGQSRVAREGLTEIGLRAGDDVALAVRQGGVAAGDALLAERATQAAADQGASFAESQGREAVRQTAARAAREAAQAPLPVLGQDLLMSAPGNQSSLFSTLTESAAPLAEGIGERPLRAAALPELAKPQTVRDIIAEQVGRGAPSGELDEIISNRLDALGSKGGLKIGGYETGLGQSLAEPVGNAVRSATKPLRELFSPTAGVRDLLGHGAAQATDSALHAGGTARRRARALLGDAIADGVTAEGKPVTQEILEQGKIAMAQDLLENGGERVASTTAKDGWSEFADGVYAPDEIVKSLNKGFGKKPNEILSAYDKLMGWAKSHITLNPVLNPSGVPRNMFGNMLFATIFGGATDPKVWEESFNLRKALIAYGRDAGEMTEQGFKDFVKASDLRLNETEMKRAWLLHDKGVAGRGGELFDDVTDEALQAKGPLGTRTYAKLLESHEELTRGAVFLQGLDEGLSASQALKKSHDAMLDYASEALTPFERNVMQRAVLFYKFPRRVIPQALEFAGRNPGEALTLSRLGLGAGLGKRNQYGEPIGKYLDTPLEAAAQGIIGPASNQNGPIEGLLDEYASPGLAFLLNQGSGARSAENLFPALGSSNRLLQGGITGWLDKAARPPGLRVGVDYALTRADDDLDSRASELYADGHTIKGKEALQLFARDDAGIKQAATMSAPDLVSILLDRGYSESTLGSILLGKTPVDTAMSR